jgi:hypothetical protein
MVTQVYTSIIISFDYFPVHDQALGFCGVCREPTQHRQFGDISELTHETANVKLLNWKLDMHSTLHLENVTNGLRIQAMCLLFCQVYPIVG